VPLPYLYFRNLALNKSIFEIKDLLHFVLPLLITIESTSDFFEVITPIEIDSGIKAMSVVMCLSYLFLTARILMKSFWRKTTPLEIKTDQEILLKKWSIVLFTTFTLTGFKLCLSFVTFGNSGLTTDNLIVLLAWKAVFLVILTSPSLLEVYVKKIKPEQQYGSKLPSFWRSKPINEITNPKDLQLSQKFTVN
jgi:hypothetical protein